MTNSKIDRRSLFRGMFGAGAFGSMTPPGMMSMSSTPSLLASRTMPPGC